LLTWSRAFAANGPMPSQPYLPGDHPPFLLRGAAWLPRCLIPPDAVNLAVLRRHAALELKRKTPARPMLANAAWLPKMGALRLATLMLPFAVNGAPSRRSARLEAYAPAQQSPFAETLGRDDLASCRKRHGALQWHGQSLPHPFTTCHGPRVKSVSPRAVLIPGL
jgi:hypothetical protein